MLQHADQLVDRRWVYFNEASIDFDARFYLSDVGRSVMRLLH
jgi:hypothetical protein